MFYLLKKNALQLWASSHLSKVYKKGPYHEAGEGSKGEWEAQMVQ